MHRILPHSGVLERIYAMNICQIESKPNAAAAAVAALFFIVIFHVI